MRNRIAATIGALGITLGVMLGVTVAASPSHATVQHSQMATTTVQHSQMAEAAGASPAPCPPGMSPAACALWNMYHHSLN